MEKVKMIKNSKKYGFNKNDAFVVGRNIMGDCVIFRSPQDNIPNLVWSEAKVRNYGILSGEPQLCC